MLKKYDAFKVKGLVCKTLSSSSKTTHQVKYISKGILVEGHFFSVKRYSVRSIVALCRVFAVLFRSHRPHDISIYVLLEHSLSLDLPQTSTNDCNTS